VETEKFGLRAEEWFIAILKEEGYVVMKSTYSEDHFDKVDLWIWYNGSYIAVQVSVDKEAIMSWKGKDALRRGIVPMWIDGDKLKAAFEGKKADGLTKTFWNRLEKIVDNFPIRRFRNPHWSSV